jgi:hypothetical protein
VYE